jgi:hypothetical protein
MFCGDAVGNVVGTCGIIIGIACVVGVDAGNIVGVYVGVGG